MASSMCTADCISAVVRFDMPETAVRLFARGTPYFSARAQAFLTASSYPSAGSICASMAYPSTPPPICMGVIASVINTMASMLGDRIISAIGFALIFIVGHTLNIAINLLGAYVHTNRLQFVEFFGKFYEGGGKGFRPFSAEKNKYFKFKEEN